MKYKLPVSNELNEAIKAKADLLGLDIPAMIAALLRFGLDAQNQREAKLDALYDDAVADRSDKSRANRLGEFIFGQ